MVSDNNNGLIVGWIDYLDNSGAPNDLWLQRLDSNGDGLWGNTGYLLADSIIGMFDMVADIEQGVFVRWRAWPFVTDTANWFCKVDEQGNVLWTNFIQLQGYNINMISDGNGGALITGTFDELWPDTQFRGFRLTSYGNWLWGESGVVICDSLNLDPYAYRARGMTILSDSSAIIYWTKVIEYNNDYQALIQKITYEGNVVYEDGGIPPSQVVALKRGAGGLVKSDQGNIIYFFGDTRESYTSGVYVQKLNQEMQPLWESTDVLFTLTGGFVLIPDGRGGAIMVWDEAPVNGIFAQQISRNGNLGEVLPPLHISPNPSIPEDFQLLQNYPNPFNPVTTIVFDIPELSDVQLTIYDLLGREVIELLNTHLKSGIHSITWDGKDQYGRTLSSEMYFYRIDAVSNETGKQFHETRKMVLLK